MYEALRSNCFLIKNWNSTSPGKETKFHVSGWVKVSMLASELGNVFIVMWMCPHVCEHIYVWVSVWHVCVIQCVMWETTQERVQVRMKYEGIYPEAANTWLWVSCEGTCRNINTFVSVGYVEVAFKHTPTCMWVYGMSTAACEWMCDLVCSSVGVCELACLCEWICICAWMCLYGSDNMSMWVSVSVFLWKCEWMW